MIKLKALLLPKIDPGESQIFVDKFLQNSEEYEICGASSNRKMKVKDGIALFPTLEGKVNVTQSLTAILLDNRFDFSECYIITIGCAGGTVNETTLGDVILETAAIDFDLGHTADFRDMADKTSEITHFTEKVYDEYSCVIFDHELTEKIFHIIKDIKLNTTEKAKATIRRNFPEKTDLDPKVKKGTTASGDNYWKGYHQEINARYIANHFNCPDEFSVSEMEDVALALVAKRFGMINRFLGIRTIVNYVRYMDGMTPESLWGDGEGLKLIASEEGVETCGIFPVAMNNLLLVVSKVIETIMMGNI